MAKSMEAEFRAKIARIAKRQVGQTACSRKTAGEPGFFTSCHSGVAGGPRELWCADFARWVWWKAGAINTAPGTDILNAGAVSFVKYGKLRSRPRVGDAVLFGYIHDTHDRPITAAHVGIVVKVNANGTIRSVSGDIGGHGKSDADFAKTSRVVHDRAYNSRVETIDPLAPNSPLSGYVSPVEDDMPYTKKQIIEMVKEGVKEELNTKLKNSKVTPAGGAEAAVKAQKALEDLQQQVAALADYVKQHLPPPTRVGPATTSGKGPGTTSGNGPGTTSGNGPATTSGTRGRRTGTRTRTSPTP